MMRKKDHEIRLMARQASLADQATLTDVELAQEEEVRVLTKRWDANYPDIQHQATQEKCRTVDILNNEIKGLEKDGVPIPADAAILAHKKIYFKNDRKKEIRATNMVTLSLSDLHLVSLSLNRSIRYGLSRNGIFKVTSAPDEMSLSVFLRYLLNLSDSFSKNTPRL